jgi:hypothetical protein
MMADGGEVRVSVPGSGVVMTYASQCERDRSVVFAQARQARAAAGGLCPSWDALSGGDREVAAVEARNWLRAGVACGLVPACCDGDDVPGGGAGVALPHAGPGDGGQAGASGWPPAGFLVRDVDDREDPELGRVVGWRDAQTPLVAWGDQAGAADPVVHAEALDGLAAVDEQAGGELLAEYAEAAADWDCEAYGPDGRGVGALCFVAEPGTRRCGSAGECALVMTGARWQLFTTITARAAAGDETSQYLASVFTSPGQLLGGPMDPPDVPDAEDDDQGQGGDGGAGVSS